MEVDDPGSPCSSQEKQEGIRFEGDCEEASHCPIGIETCPRRSHNATRYETIH
jgi:hypothetical protein